MVIYRKILVAIDLSEEAWHAYKEALKVIKDKDTWAIIVTVVPTLKGDLSFLLFDNIPKKIFKPYEELLERAKSVAAEKGVLAKFLLEEGEPYEKIVDLVYSENCDLIILGKTGNRTKRLLLGSTAARVIGYSPVDILIIPSESEVSWERLLIAVDFSKFSERAFKRGIELARFYQSKLMLLSVIDWPIEAFTENPQLYERIYTQIKNNLKCYQAQATKEGIDLEVLIEEGDPAERILERAATSDLIIMGSHGKKGLKRVLLGSVTEKVISLGKKPVLVVK